MGHLPYVKLPEGGKWEMGIYMNILYRYYNVITGPHIYIRDYIMGISREVGKIAICFFLGYTGNVIHGEMIVDDSG
jgi:hypothetical protein